MWRKCNRDVGDGCNIYLHGCGCPCGYFSDAVRECNCSALAIARYQKRISGPLLDRIDIHIEVPRVDYEKLARKRQVETSATIRARVQAARERQIRGCVEREPDAFHVVFWKGVSERREVTVMGNRITRAAMHVSADEVQERIRREKQPWRRQRWEIISQALTAPRHDADIAGTVGVSLSTVYRVIALYQQAGVAAIETPGKGGRRRHYLTLWQERAFLQPCLARAARGDIATVAQIQQAYEQEIKQAGAPSTVSRLLARHGWQQVGAGASPAATPQSRPAQADRVPVRERREPQFPSRSAHRERSPQRYPSDLSDQEWVILAPLIPPAQLGGRPRRVDMREVLTAMLYLDRTGCQ